MQLTDKQLEIVDAEGHVLVTGGPGSGKTTVSILKAAHTAQSDLRPGQRILFLSFARASVSRVVEAIEYEQQIPREQKRRLDVETYHSFFWRILKAHGYLIGLPRWIDILTPPAEAIALSGIRSGYGAASKLTEAERAEKKAAEETERLRLAGEDGGVCFDLFAPYFGDILHGSERIRKLLATMYPVIILDEFQDTNAEQWLVVQALGEFSTLIALADPEQRIYDWIGADPERLNHFREAFEPTEVDLSTDNHRSADTEIVVLGNDILKGEVRQEEPYVGVQLYTYPPYADRAFSRLVTMTYKARAVHPDCSEISGLGLWPETLRTQGVGTALIQAAEGLVLARGRVKVGVGVEKNNPRTQDLYKRLGYRDSTPYLDCGSYEDSAGLIHRVADACTFMVKLLQPAEAAAQQP